MSALPRIALIGTGGTISSLGESPLELCSYIDRACVCTVDELLARIPQAREVADVVTVPFAAVQSTAMGPARWLELLRTVHRVVADDPGLDGVVITHGTATLEETAYFLNLTLKVAVPVVLVGAQRPATGLSADGPLNLVNALRTAGCPDARGKGVLVVLNDEVHAAREVTKTSTFRLQTFRSPDFGVLAHADEDRVAFYRAPLRRCYPDTEFDVGDLQTLPRVDVSMAYAGADGAAIDAFVAAGARGIVAAGFGPSLNTPAQLDALQAAADAGVMVAQGARVGSGRIIALGRFHVRGGVTVDNLNAVKARVLLMLALTVSGDAAGIQRMLETY